MGASDFPQWKKYLLELVGAFAMCFFGAAMVVVGFLVPSLDDLSRLFLDSLVPGVTLGTCIATFAKYSGSHVNPAITVTFASGGIFKMRHVAPYVIFQLVGGLIAGFSLWAIFDSRVPSAFLGASRLGPGISPLVGVALEVIDTALLCTVILWVATSARGPRKQGAIVGVATTAVIFFFAPISGASLNPLRSFVTALFSGYFDGLYVFLISPVLGAVLAGVIFRAVRKRS